MSEYDEGSVFKPGDRIEVFQVPGGYVVAPAGTLDELEARHIADAAAPMTDGLPAEEEIRISWEPRR
jgi:hypothetical protein